MSEHCTVWEDAGMAGIECDGKDAGTLDAEWVKCQVCGEEIKLSWMVAIIARRPRKTDKNKRGER